VKRGEERESSKRAELMRVGEPESSRVQESKKLKGDQEIKRAQRKFKRGQQRV
jgi:hypothetical protein